MKKNNKILDKLIQAFELLIDDNEMINRIQEYFLDNIDEEFLLEINEIDFDLLSKETLDKLGETYVLMRKSKNLLYIKKYINILFKMAKGKAGYIVYRDCSFNINIEDNILLVAEIDVYVVAAIHSYILTMGYECRKLHKENYKIIYKMCNENKEEVLKSLNYVEPLYKMLLSSLYCHFLEDEISKQLIEDIEKYFIQNINNVYYNNFFT